MRMPNLYIAPYQSATLDLAKYNVQSAEKVEVEDSSVAEVKLSNNTLTVDARGEGQTTYTVTYNGGKSATATITVRIGANDNGWF